MEKKWDYSGYSLEELHILARNVGQYENPEKYAEVMDAIKQRKMSPTAHSENPQFVLTFGIVGLVLSLVAGAIGLIVTLIAWSVGDSALKRYRARGQTSGVEYSNTVIGRNCAMIGALIILARLTLAWLASQ